MPRLFKYVATVGHCVILAQIIGTEHDGTEVPSFFAAYMITKDGKPSCSTAEAAFYQRIIKNRNTVAELVPFCQGYSLAAQERRSQAVWYFQGGSIEPDHIETPPQAEIDRLRAWPNVHGHPHCPPSLTF